MVQSPARRRKEKVTWMEKARIQLLIWIQTRGETHRLLLSIYSFHYNLSSFRTEQGNHLVSILCGLVGAIVLVFLVIIVTMKVSRDSVKQVHLFWN